MTVSPERRERRVTASDVAKAAGVSRTAVSRAFTEGSYLDKAKREKILLTAQDLGYRPNAFAASLQKTESNIVAVITGNMKSMFDGELVDLLVHRLTDAGKWPIVVSGAHFTDQTTIEGIFGFPVDAMIVRGGSMDQYVVDACSKFRIPLIFSGCRVDAPGVDSVACNNADGTYDLTRHLIRKGRRNFGLIDGPPSVGAPLERRDGVTRALKEAGLELQASINGDFSFDGGQSVARELLKNHDLDALICANDAMAIAALSVLRDELGRRVPEDISVVGFDNVQMAQWPCFDLTTVSNPTTEIADEIMRLLGERLNDPAKPSETVLLGGNLVLRGTD